MVKWTSRLPGLVACSYQACIASSVGTWEASPVPRKTSGSLRHFRYVGMRSRRRAPRPTRWPWTRMNGCGWSSSWVMPGMLRHQQQLLGQVGDGRMVSPGPQLNAQVADSLDAGLVLDLSQELECLDAELARLVDLALIDTDRGPVGQVAGPLLGRVRVNRTHGFLKHSVGSFRLSQADVDLALETGQPWAVVVVEPGRRCPWRGGVEDGLGGL